MDEIIEMNIDIINLHEKNIKIINDFIKEYKYNNILSILKIIIIIIICYIVLVKFF